MFFRSWGLYGFRIFNFRDRFSFGVYDKIFKKMWIYGVWRREIERVYFLVIIIIFRVEILFFKRNFTLNGIRML